MSNSNDGYEWPLVAIKIMYVPIRTAVMASHGKSVLVFSTKTNHLWINRLWDFRTIDNVRHFIIDDSPTLIRLDWKTTGKEIST